MIKSNSGTYQLDIQKRIASARQETRTLYYEVENIRNRIQDATLFKVASDVEMLSSDKFNLKLYNTLRGHQNKIAQIRWNSNSRHILSASQDGYMIIWDTVSGFKKHAISLENQWVLACAIAPKGESVASGGLDNTLTVYNIKPRNYQYGAHDQYQTSIRSLFKGHKAYISDCDYISNEKLITASGDMTCIMWDINKGGKVRDFVDHIGDVLVLAKFSDTQGNPESPIFVSGSSDGYAKIWDLRCQFAVQSFPVSNSDINCIKVFPDNHSFMTGSDDGIIRLFDMRSDCELSNYSLSANLHKLDLNNLRPPVSRSYPESPTDQISRVESTNSSYDTPGVVSLDFSRSGRLLYSCYSDYGCIIWDTLKGNIVGALGMAGHLNKVNQVSSSPDGLIICTASWDQTIKVWSV
ncbi:unnamed protein product [Debaryomyces tyrocola]|nr:unnamed protein product [Debaryomyces tyrocola]